MFRFSAPRDKAIAGVAWSRTGGVAAPFFEDKSLREVGIRLAIGEDAAQKRVAKVLKKSSARIKPSFSGNIH